MPKVVRKRLELTAPFCTYDFMSNLMTDKLTQDLIWTLDLSLFNGVVVDGNNPLLLDGKTLCYPCVEDEDLNRLVSNFNPFTNKKLAQMLFERYIRIRMYEDPDLKVEGYNIYVTPHSPYAPPQCNAVCKTNQGVYTSHVFSNESVAWVELINIMDDKVTPDMTYMLYTIDVAVNVTKNINRRR